MNTLVLSSARKRVRRHEPVSTPVHTLLSGLLFVLAASTPWPPRYRREDCRAGKRQDDDVKRLLDIHSRIEEAYGDVSNCNHHEADARRNECAFPTPLGTESVAPRVTPSTLLLFRDAIDYRPVRIHARRYMPLQPKNCAMTPNGSMYFHWSCFLDDFSQANRTGQHWFMHEMVLLWQSAHPFALSYWAVTRSDGGPGASTPVL